MIPATRAAALPRPLDPAPPGHHHNTGCPLTHLALDARNQLHRHGTATIGALLTMTKRDVLDVREIGRGTLDIIIGALAEHGLTLTGGAR
jgi:Bacterial RNA polymerase, alpha chain C terminal domain